MKGLHAAYESFISDIARVIPVIKVDYNRFRTAEEMAAMIKAEYKKIANVRHVSWGGSKADKENLVAKDVNLSANAGTPSK